MNLYKKNYINKPTQNDLYESMVKSLVLERPIDRRSGETEYLSTLVHNGSCLMDVPGDRYFLFSCLFYMYHADIVDFKGKLMSTMDIKISPKNHYVYMVYTMR